jgi:YfiR/HmsC-like
VDTVAKAHSETAALETDVSLPPVPAFVSKNTRRNLMMRRFLLLLVFISAPCMSVEAEEPHPTEYQVQAAYLYNFGKFVRWPANAALRPGAPFTLCVLGKDPFQGALDSLVTGQTVGGSPVAVQRVADTKELGACRLLYATRAESTRFKTVLDAARRLPVITVSDAPDFLQRGGIIQFVIVNNRVRFAINLDAAREAHLQLSAELLKVATKVIGENVIGEVEQ